MTDFRLAAGRGRALDCLEAGFVSGRLSRRSFIAGSLALGMSIAAGRSRAQELEPGRANQEARAANVPDTFDYIICGGGVTGCIIAAQLTSAGHQVVLLEAGGWDDAESILNPAMWFTNLGGEFDWNFAAEAEASLNGRALPSHMGRVIGGGSSINATIWARGHRRDYDHWAEVTGEARWGYDAALDQFRKAEDWRGVPSDYRGKGGPIWVEPSQNPHPLAPALLAAAAGQGFTTYDDLNGAREESEGGFALMNHIIRDGRRQNIARSYLYPVLDRPNLTVLTGATVSRIMTRAGEATGVVMTWRGETRELHAGREVIVTQGAVNSAKLLLLSGIGAADDLKKLGIDVIADNAEVGQNFQDHILHGGVLFEAPAATPHHNSGAEAAGFWKSDPSLDRPDINLVQIELPYASERVAADFTPPPSSWALCAGLVAPQSRGRVTLRSADPADLPRIDANTLADPQDVAALVKGIELCRRLGGAPELADFVVREVAPGSGLSQAQSQKFARDGATSYFHQAGTCRMGKDEASVVDPELRVRGVARLRVADGSVMPRIPSAATMATCVFIGLTAAALIEQV